jgi:hypothetical protein
MGSVACWGKFVGHEEAAASARDDGTDRSVDRVMLLCYSQSYNKLVSSSGHLPRGPHLGSSSAAFLPLCELPCPFHKLELNSCSHCWNHDAQVKRALSVFVVPG